MADKCVDCGAFAELYENGVPVCLICAEVRDAKAIQLTPTVSETLDGRRKDYRLALEDLQKATTLLRDLEPANRDGFEALRQANGRFAEAKDAYLKAANAFIENARRFGKKS